MNKKIKNDQNHAFTDIVAAVTFESLIRFDQKYQGICYTGKINPTKFEDMEMR